jgi:nitroreductase / dihydropteridine reductase
MPFKEIVMRRYAAKVFDGRRIDEGQVQELLEMVRYAPSALNLQPWKIRVITDQNLKEELFLASWNQQQITTCSHLLVFCANLDIQGLIARLEAIMREADVSEEIVDRYICFTRDFVRRVSTEDLLPWAQNNVFIALGNALNGAKALGFDSCPMTAFDREEYAKILALPKSLVPTVLCPIGYAADSPTPKLRFPLEEIIF